MFISVVLPAPFSPTSAWMSPARIERDASWTATSSSKRLAICVMLIASAPGSTALLLISPGGASPPAPFRLLGVRDRRWRRHRGRTHFLLSGHPLEKSWHDDPSR